MSNKFKFSVFNDEDDDVTNSDNEAQNKAEEVLAFQRGDGGSTCFVRASVNHQVDDSPSEPWREHSVQRVEKTVRNRLLYDLSPDAALVVQGRLQVSWITSRSRPGILSITGGTGGTGGTDIKRLERFDLTKLSEMLDDIDSEKVTFICDLSAISKGARSIMNEVFSVLRSNSGVLLPIVIGDRDVHSATIIKGKNDWNNSYFENCLLNCNSSNIAPPSLTLKNCSNSWQYDDRMVVELENAIRHSSTNHIVVFMCDADTTSTSSISHTIQTIMGNTQRINEVLNTLSITNKCVEIWMWSENCARAKQIRAHVNKEKLNVTIKSLALFRSHVLFSSVRRPIESFLRSPKVLKTCARSRNENTVIARDLSGNSDTDATESSVTDDDNSSVDGKTSCSSEDERSTATFDFVVSKIHKALPDNLAPMLQMATCPLTGAIVQDPVLAPCGHHFERSSIEQRLESKAFCPICYTSMHKSQLYPCLAWKEIASLLETKI